ncbi:SMP-30/Gluconolaconase/LRE-like region-containing protein [uncultured Mycobacterium sp.]|uniref:SMP-30/Gluconolaconase/LRE-like region-containing protein n=1 Tax=uncultured Mycobacterium sp. TaxID=171292 RepID=A0A1Y5P922_9MYCO|nr:SMP-30/Gluconolaconase/LRE-like region-containing protein [uncultured Mycobacterium sp.]
MTVIGSLSRTALADGFCFGEGPRWFEGLLWLSDMLGEAVHTVTLDGSVTTLNLPGHAPAGLGFRPDGTLLIVSTERRVVLRYDGDAVTEGADLSRIAPADLGDMVVDAAGRAYIGSQAREGGIIARLDPDDSVTVVAEDLDFPNGMAITPDGRTLIVAESVGRRLTAYDIDGGGGLSGRRVFADGLDGPPDGIALDAAGGVWTSMTLAHQFERVEAGGAVTDRIDIGDRAAIACMLGGPDRQTLFLVTTPDAYPQRLVGTKGSCVETVRAEIPGAGFPSIER